MISSGTMLMRTPQAFEALGLALALQYPRERAHARPEIGRSSYTRHAPRSVYSLAGQYPDAQIYETL